MQPSRCGIERLGQVREKVQFVIYSAITVTRRNANRREDGGALQVVRACHAVHPFALSSQAGHWPQP